MMERQFLFCLVLLAIPALTIQQVCPDGYDEVDGRCFFISNVERSFEQAKYDCMYRGGGSLVTINDAEDREDAMEGSSGPVAYWIDPESLDVDFYSDVQDLNCYICEASPVCPTTTHQLTEFDYGAAVQAYADLNSAMDSDVATEVGMDTFLEDLSAYRQYDGTPWADLPDTDSITIMPEHWALTYTDPQNPYVTTILSLPETENFDPNVGLPAELPSSAMEAYKENFPLFNDRYLSDMATRYANSRNDVVFDEATYGPDAACPYPPSTDLGGGFALARMGTTLCRVTRQFEGTDPVTARIIFIGYVGIDIVDFGDFAFIGHTYIVRVTF